MIRAARPRQHGTSEEHDVTDSAVVPQGNSALRLALLFAIGLNLAMIAIRVATYRPLLAMPGSLCYVLEPAGLLVAYAGIVVWATRRAGPLRQTVLEVGLRVGLLTGGLQIVHLAIEMFAPLSGSANAITSLSFMFGTFLIWGFAGFSSVRRTGSVGHGAAAGSWAAIMCMVSVLLFGFALMFSPFIRASKTSRRGQSSNAAAGRTSAPSPSRTRSIPASRISQSDRSLARSSEASPACLSGSGNTANRAPPLTRNPSGSRVEPGT